MAKYEIRVIEQSSRTIEVDANSREEAVVEVKDLYKNGSIVLDAEDFDCVNFF